MEASSLRLDAEGRDRGSRYFGVDLAWTETGWSGACVLDADGTILDEDQLPASALVGWIRAWRGSRSVLALDGPLVVPPDSPALRPVERELHRRYGRYHAGPFPGGAGSRTMRGRSRSPAAALADAAGPFVVDPTDHVSAHRAIEVFPAPTWIELFGLRDRVAYKKGPRAARIAALASLHDLLRGLTSADPPLRVSTVDRISELTLQARTVRGWKAVEDITDARFCAYVAQLWGRTPDRNWIVTGEGAWQDGYVIVPSIRASAPADIASSEPRFPR